MARNGICVEVLWCAVFVMTIADCVSIYCSFSLCQNNIKHSEFNDNEFNDISNMRSEHYFACLQVHA